MKNSMLIVLFISLSVFAFSQEAHKLTGRVTNFPGGLVYLASFYGERAPVVDSLIISQDGVFEFEMNSSKTGGYYRVILIKDRYIDLIYNHENIVFSTDYENPFDSLHIITSQENKIYYDFLSFIKNNQLKQDLLGPMVEYYPKDDPLYKEIRVRYHDIQQNRRNYIDSISEQYSGTYVSRVITTQQRPFLSADLIEKERIEYLKDHFWDEIPLNDTSLLRSTVYPNLVMEYLSLYGDRSFSQTELEESFMDAVDVIQWAALDNDIIYGFILEYLIKGFERYHFDKVLDHIANNYAQEENCKNENLSTEVQKRLENYQNLSVGKPAPAINMVDINQNSVTLNNRSSEYLLLVFWASWCPHCIQLLPRLTDIYSNNDLGLEIIAISLDNNQEDHLKAVEEGTYPWINCSDYKGWNSQAAVDYNIYATPTMFLLDKERNIITKPITYRELMIELGKL
ncbi:MAG: redoxin domain-containing protein [Bacteroidales bacterium]|nr:redoxin domain-containing protein [Bacteroidales bacterium]